MKLAHLLVLLAVVTTGCSTSRLLVLQEPGGAQPSLGAGRQRIAAYVNRNGQRLTFDGYVEVVGDSLRFDRPAITSRGLERDLPEIVRWVPRDSVVSVEALSLSVPRSIALGVGVAGLFALFALIGFALSFKNEPLL